MEAIILGNPYLEDFSSTTPIEIPAYTAEEAVIVLSDGYNPYVIGGSPGSTVNYWFRYNTGVLTPLTSSDRVVIGGTSFVNTELFRVVGKLNSTTLQLGSSVTISAVLDEDNMASNSNTAVPTQQSVKAYVDNQLSSTGLQIGDNVSLLTNDSGYITSETDPIFVASPSYTITSSNISNWSTAYSWGNHAGLYSLVSHNHSGVYQPLDGDLTAIAALAGTSGLLRKTAGDTWSLDTASYLSSYTETDPIFVASAAYGITGTDITNWGTAYTNTHTHSNLGTLNNITAAGSGNNALFDDGTYKSVLRTVGGSNTQIQYNNSGALAGSANLTFDSSTNTVSTVNIATTGTTSIGDALTTLTKNVGGDLVFTDANSGSVTLATIVGGATNYWTTTTGGIFYTNYVGINNPATLDEALTVNGNIQASNFNSSYLRYKNSNLLLGPDAGDNETGSNLLYIANSNTSSPLIYGDFLNQNITFNADVYINQIKRLNFGSSDVYIRRDSSDNLVLRDLNANGGVEVTLTDLTTLTGYALKSDFTSYTSVTTITAANKTTWNKASVITTSGGGTNFLADDGTYKPGGGGGVTPTDNILKWDSGSSYYRVYTDKTEAGGISSGGKFYGGTSDPTNSNRLNYDGNLYVNDFRSINNVQASIVTGLNGSFGNNLGGSALGISISGTTNNNQPVFVIQKSISGSANATGNIITILDNPTTSGTISGSVLKATIGSNVRIDMNPRVANSGTNTAYILDTHNNLTGTTNILTLSNQGVLKAYVTNSGNIVGATINANGGSTYGILGYSDSSNAGNFQQNSSVGNSLDTVVVSRNTSGTASSNGDILSLQENSTSSGTITGNLLRGFWGGTEKSRIDKDGYIYIGSATTDGCWRFAISGNNLQFQRRESGSWVMKAEIVP